MFVLRRSDGNATLTAAPQRGKNKRSFLSNAHSSFPSGPDRCLRKVLIGWLRLEPGVVF